MGWTKVARAADVGEQSGQCVEVEGKRLALFNLNGEFFAIDDACTHMGGPLSEGAVQGEQVQCPWHGALFQIKTGEVGGPPAGAGVSCYKVQVSGGDIEIDL